MSTSTCPVCHSPVNPADDVCENCGAVLSTIVIPPVKTVPPPPAPVTQAASQDECPRCHTRRNPGKSFCGRCGFKYAMPTNNATTTLPSDELQAPIVQLAMDSVINDKYKIEKAIGTGGMGSVYLARDIILKRQVVIKTLVSNATPGMVEQSVKEREFLASIKHANIVSIYDFITIGKQGYIVMEYVHGKTLDDIMEEQGKPFEVEDAIRYILGILPAFSYLAKLGLVYCDFKPQNVMLEALKDGTQIVKLIDLGTVIKYAPRPDDVYGTHGFYAPEAVKNPSPETDLYSICRTLAYMVTMMDLSNPIFGMPSSEYYKTFRDHPALYHLLYKGTHPKPAQRFHSAEELSDQLNDVLRLIVGGTPGIPVNSRLFVSSVMTTTGKPGLRAEVALDEKDKAISELRYGDQSLRSGNFNNALTLYRQALHVNPQSVDAYLRLVEVLIEMGEFSQALAEITKVQRMAPGNWKIAWYTGRLLEAQEKYTAAADQYRELMADLPGEIPPQLALARVSARQGEDNAAVELYSGVIKADPGNIDAILGITNSYLNLQRWDEAAQVLSGVSEAAAKFVDAQILLCELYIHHMTPLTAQNVERASQAVEVLTGRTEDARYYLVRGDIYRAAWQLSRSRKLQSSTTIAGVADTRPRTLGAVAEESYAQYLRRTKQPDEREAIVRRKLEVAPWRLFSGNVPDIRHHISIGNLWQQIRNTLRGRFTLFAICLIILALAQGLFLAHSFQQAASDLDTISSGSIPSVDAAQAIAQYIEDIDARSADYLATAALTTAVPCQIVGSNANPGPLTVHDCDDRNIAAEIVAANHQVFLAAHNVTYPGERTAMERIIAGFQDYIAQIQIMRHEYGLAASKSNIHDQHLQLAHQAYIAANNVLTTRITAQATTDATRETNLPSCTIAGHTMAPNDWVSGSIRDNLDCLSYINRSHLDAAYNDTVNFLGATVALSIISCIIFSLLISGATWSMIAFTHRVVNIGLTLALLVSIIFGIASVARLAQASGRHGDFGQMVQDDYNSIYYAALLKEYGTDANADEARWLISLEFGDSTEAARWQQDWTTNTAQVRQLISSAVANRTWAEEDQPLADMQTNWNKYIQIDGRIRSTANAGRILDAERLSTGASNATFGNFTDAVDRLSQANRGHYNSTLKDTQGALPWYIFLSAILFPLAGLSAAWGIVQRLKDF